MRICLSHLSGSVTVGSILESSEAVQRIGMYYVVGFFV